MNWTRAPVLHRVNRFCGPMARRLRRARDVMNKIGVTNGICTRAAAFTEPSANSYTMVNIGNEKGIWIRLPVPPRPGPAYKTGASLLCQTGITGRDWQKPSRAAWEAARQTGRKSCPQGVCVGRRRRQRHAPHSASAERSVFETVPARLSGSASIFGKLVPRHGNAPCSAD